MPKYDRLLFILNLLRSRRNLNAARIAGECGVTERTIYRDIISLSEANIPIYYDRGYKYASDNFLPPLNFDVDEYLTLKTVLETSPLNKSGPDRRIIKSIKTKIEAGLSQTVRREKAMTTSPTSVRIKSTTSDLAKERYYAIVEDAIRKHLIINLQYDSIESGLTKRKLEPYFMIFIERAFYFVGYCYLRKELRTFRIDRIRNISLTDKKFATRRNIDPAAYFKDSWGVFSGEPVMVEVIFSGRAARIITSGRHHSSEEIIPLDGDKIKYRARVSGIKEIRRWLMGFGGEAKVLKPLSLADDLRKQAGAILKRYRLKKS
jgi:predicted DNA-binding transcriptional regulator YafY